MLVSSASASFPPALLRSHVLMLMPVPHTILPHALPCPPVPGQSQSWLRDLTRVGRSVVDLLLLSALQTLCAVCMDAPLTRPLRPVCPVPCRRETALVSAHVWTHASRPRPGRCPLAKHPHPPAAAGGVGTEAMNHSLPLKSASNFGALHEFHCFPEEASSGVGGSLGRALFARAPNAPPGGSFKWWPGPDQWRCAGVAVARPGAPSGLRERDQRGPSMWQPTAEGNPDPRLSRAGLRRDLNAF